MSVPRYSEEMKEKKGDKQTVDDDDCVSSVMFNSQIHCGPNGVDPDCLCLHHSVVLISSDFSD